MVFMTKEGPQRFVPYDYKDDGSVLLLHPEAVPLEVVAAELGIRDAVIVRSINHPSLYAVHDGSGESPRSIRALLTKTGRKIGIIDGHNKLRRGAAGSAASLSLLALAGCAADTVPNSTHDTSQQAGQAQVYDNSDDEGNQDITQLVKPSLEQVLVSEEQLHYLLKNRFGYDTKKPTPESPDHFSEEYLTQLRQEAHFRGLEILAEFYDVLPEPKHTEDGYDQPSAKINLLHRLENEISDIYFEAISNLSDEQIDKLKRLFNYVKTAATDYDRIFHTLGSIAFGLQEPTLTVEEKQRKGFAWDSQLFKTHPEKFIDEKTGKAREPQLEDYRELAEHEVRDRKGRFERGQRNFEFFTSEKMFALYDRYQAFGLHIFDGLFTLDSNLSPGFATPQNPNADYDFFMERYGFQAATTDALKEKIDYFKKHF